MRELFRRHPRFNPTDPDEDDQRDLRAQVPDDLWVKCPKCGELSYSKEHLHELRVCQRCGYHFRLAAHERIRLLADDDSFTEWDIDILTADPLEFEAGDGAYIDKARRAASRLTVNEALVSGRIAISSRPAAIAVTDFAFMGASMGSVYGEKLARACERAIDENMPLITVSSSGGARMQEGLFSLMQMAKTTAGLSRLSEARLPHISILTDPCYGGIPASYATVADVILAEPGAMIGFAGPRVIEQVTRQKLPPGFQTAEFLHEHGMIDLVVPRSQMRTTLSTMLELYANRPARRTRRRREMDSVESDALTGNDTTMNSNGSREPGATSGSTPSQGQ